MEEVTGLEIAINIIIMYFDMWKVVFTGVTFDGKVITGELYWFITFFVVGSHVVAVLQYAGAIEFHSPVDALLWKLKMRKGLIHDITYKK